MIKKKQNNGKIEIDLTGPHGNAFYILGVAKSLCKQLDFNESFVLNEMKSGDYDNLIKVFDKYFGSVVTMYN
jgi:hypothetical protein